MEFNAYAKLNLTLDILLKREDGYHDLQMVMQSIDLCDRLTLSPARGEGEMRTNLAYLPADGRNLAQMAAEAFRRATGKGGAVDIAIEKNIPVCAGMGGGSSDAAAVLRAMNELTGAGLSLMELAGIGQNVGSDVPYCVLGGTALAEGRGGDPHAAAGPAPLPCGGVQAGLPHLHAPALRPGQCAAHHLPPGHPGTDRRAGGGGSAGGGPADVQCI